MTHREVSVTPKFETTDNVEVSVHLVEDLKEKFPQWRLLSRKEKLRLSREVEPIQESSSSNTTCVGLNEYLVDDLDTNQSVNEAATHLAVGDDNTTPVSANTDLNNEVGRFSVTTTSDTGSTLQTSTFIQSGQANGNTLKEVGLVNQSSSTNDILFNHSLISDIEKTSSKTATLDVSLSFSSV